MEVDFSHSYVLANIFTQTIAAQKRNGELGQQICAAFQKSGLCSTIGWRGNVSHLCYICPLMPDNKRLLELALKGLEAERSRIDEEIAELTSLRMQRVGNERTPRKTRTIVAGSSVTGHALTGSKPKRKGTLTAAGRKKLSEAAKRRWAANRKTGKTTL